MSSKKISQLTEKNSVIATDIVTILDSADSFGNKKTTMGAIKTLVIPSTADITGDTLITVGNGTNVALGSTSVTLTLDNDLSKYNNTTSGFITSSDIPALPSDTDLSNYDNTNSAFITLAEVPALPTNTDLADYDNTTSAFITGIAWGDITGTLADQTDLSTALSGKADVRNTVTDLVSTTITLANANANTDYQYGELTALEITANDTSYLETNIWFTAGEGLNSVTIPATLIPMNDFAPIEGNKCCICIMNDTVLFGTEV